jgi:hypothetical protein
MNAPRLQAPPTKQTQYGKAWRIDLSLWRQYAASQGAGTAGAEVSAWIVEAPWAHPVWHSYLLMAIHLRGAPDLPAPVIHLPGASHECAVIALNPEYTPTLDRFPRYLRPLNFTGQWVAESDEAAAVKIEACVDEILSGVLSPDTDYMRKWIERFSDSNIKAPWKGIEGATIIAAGAGGVTVIGTGKTAMEAITTIAAGPIPPPDKQH